MRLLASKEIESGNETLWTIDYDSNQNIYLSGSNKILQKFIFNQKTGEIKETETAEEIHSKTIRHLQLSPDQNFLAAGSFDASISIWSNIRDIGQL